MQNLITKHLDIWTAAHKTRSGVGRGSSNKLDLYGIKKLRELILELAVRGKLVPQDPNDEPASELLKKIAAEKAKLIKEGKIKKEKPLPEITDEEQHFELPSGWDFIRLGELTSKLGSGSTPRGGQATYQGTGVIFLRSQNVWNDGLKLDDTAYISDETHRSMEGTHVFPNDILLNITGASLGRTTIFPTKLKIANVSQHVTIIRLIESKMVKFVHLGIMSPIVQRLVWGRQVGMAIEGLSKKVLEQFEFPVPPLAEQQRIVAKVDELMTFCDQLEQAQSDNIAAHAQLVEALLTSLTNSINHKELQSNWQRIAKHFDTLFTTEHSIDQLKQTILQLAVMGKLVPQNPKDEPASELLKKIAAEKEQLIKEGNIKKEKPLPEITDEEKPFELPREWSWVCWGAILAYDDAAFKRGPFGSSLTKGMFISEGYKIYEQYCPINDDCSFERYYISEKKFEELKGFAVKEGDFLVSCTGATLGRITQVPANFKAGIINQALLRVRINSEFIDSNFFKLMFRSPFFQKSIFANSKGSAIPNVKSVGDLKIMPVPLLSIKEQKRIVIKADELMSLCEALKTNIQSAQTTQLALANVLVEQAI